MHSKSGPHRREIHNDLPIKSPSVSLEAWMTPNQEMPSKPLMLRLTLNSYSVSGAVK